MKSFTVTQKIFAIGSTYEVRETGSDVILNIVKGKIFTFSPKLEMKKDENGAATHLLKGNYWRTKFSIESADGMEIASIQFPFIAFFKKFTLVAGDKTVTASGSFTAWNFTGTDESGNQVFTITKEFAFRDKFTVTVESQIPSDVIILAAIAVDQKFFQQR